MSDLAWGLGMTVAGMGTVFALLLLLMALLYLIGWLDRPKPEPAAVGGSTSSVPGATAAAAIGSPPDAHIDAEADAESDVEVEASPRVRVLADGLTEDQLAAITVAVLTHRDTQRHQAAPEQRAHQPGSQLYASRWVSVGRAQQTQPWRRK